MKGQLREHPLAELINEISAGGLTGALRLSRERAKAVAYFVGGGVCYAASNLRVHRLSALLRFWNVIPPERLSQLISDSMSDEEVCAALSDSGAVSGEELEGLRARQSAEALRLALLWDGGDWAFDPAARVGVRTHAPVGLTSLLAEAARRLPPAFVASRLRDHAETVSPAGSGVPEGLQLSSEEMFVLSRVTGPASVGELLAVSGLPEAETLRAVYALTLCGLLRREREPLAFGPEWVAQARAAQASAGRAADEPAEEKAEQPEDPRADLDLFFTRAAGETHYEVLGVTRSARGEEIKKAYYAIARRFHPDRFRRDADERLLARVEDAFGRVARAYDVLKDPKARAAYDLKIDRAATRPPAPAQTPAAADAPKPPAPPASPGSPAQDAASRAAAKFREGLAALERGEIEQALTCLAQAALQDPKQPHYHAHYGRALARDQRTRRRAEAEFKTAVSLEPQNGDYRVMLAEFYRDVGLRSRAVAELEQALKLAPEHKQARRLLRDLQGA